MSHQAQKEQNALFAIEKAFVYEELSGTFELGTLAPDFYSTISKKMGELSQDDLLKANKVLRKLTTKRIGKITRMASHSKLAQIVEVKLANEEKKLYNAIYDSCNGFKDIVLRGEQNVKE
jgi:DNA replication initiation complex subunit (GINS family)